MAVNAGNLFSAETLSQHMIRSLPEEPTPQLRNSSDALALLLHACMLAFDFRLVGLGEESKIEASSDEQNTKPLPKEWNPSSSNYAFRYAHSQSSMEYVIKMNRLGSKIVVNGLAVGDEKVHILDMPIKDFISESSFPFSLTGNGDKDEENLRHVFISAGRMTDAASLAKLKIIQKLAPGLRKEGYEDTAHDAGQTGRSADNEARTTGPYAPQRPDPLRDDRLPRPAQPQPFNDPLAAAPRRPFPQGDFPPPGFEDEHDILRAPGRGGVGGGRPYNIGERDLYPQGLGPNDPFRGGPGFGPGGGGGGMHPTFEDPMFGGRGDGGVYDPRLVALLN